MQFCAEKLKGGAFICHTRPVKSDSRPLWLLKELLLNVSLSHIWLVFFNSLCFSAEYGLPAIPVSVGPWGWMQTHHQGTGTLTQQWPSLAT